MCWVGNDFADLFGWVIARPNSIALTTQPSQHNPSCATVTYPLMALTGRDGTYLPMSFLENSLLENVFTLTVLVVTGTKMWSFFLVPGTVLLHFSHSSSKLTFFIMLIVCYKCFDLAHCMHVQLGMQCVYLVGIWLLEAGSRGNCIALRCF